MMRTTRVQAEELAERIRAKFPSSDLLVAVREDLSHFGLPEYLIEVSRDGDGVLFSLESLDGGPGAIRQEALAVISALAGARPNEDDAKPEDSQATGDDDAKPEDAQVKRRRSRKQDESADDEHDNPAPEATDL